MTSTCHLGFWVLIRCARKERRYKYRQELEVISILESHFGDAWLRGGQAIQGVSSTMCKGMKWGSFWHRAFQFAWSKGRWRKQMEMSWRGVDSLILSAFACEAKLCRFCLVSNRKCVPISSNIIKVEQLHILTPSLQYVMRHCEEEAGAQNTAQEMGGGGRWNRERLCLGNVWKYKNKKRSNIWRIIWFTFFHLALFPSLCLPAKRVRQQGRYCQAGEGKRGCFWRNWMYPCWVLRRLKGSGSCREKSLSFGWKAQGDDSLRMFALNGSLPPLVV